MLWQRWWSVGSLENDLLKILSSVLRKTKHTCFYFLMLEGIVPEQLWVITSLQPALFCHELHPRTFLSCGTLLTTVQWAVSTGRPSPLPPFHTLMSSMLHGEPEDSCDVIITIFPLLGPGQQALGSKWCVLGALLVEHSVLLDVAPGWHFFETIGEIRVACLPDSTKLAQWAWLASTL